MDLRMNYWSSSDISSATDGSKRNIWQMALFDHELRYWVSVSLHCADDAASLVDVSGQLGAAAAQANGELIVPSCRAADQAIYMILRPESLVSNKPFLRPNLPFSPYPAANPLSLRPPSPRRPSSPAPACLAVPSTHPMPRSPSPPSAPPSPAEAARPLADRWTVAMSRSL